MKDTIYRQDATSIPVMPKEHRKYFYSLDDAYETGWNDALTYVNMLPSAERKGHWILHQDSRTWECSECHKYQVIWSNYCMHCGADMRGEEDDERQSNRHFKQDTFLGKVY